MSLVHRVSNTRSDKASLNLGILGLKQLEEDYCLLRFSEVLRLLISMVSMAFKDGKYCKSCKLFSGRLRSY